ncbi:MAG: transketolase, partial [Bacteroidetes bacterium]|nr:transketolase [Bacteroidota bacterium]
IKDIPAISGSRFNEALMAEKGAYIVQKDEGNPDIVLVANGSEVSTLLAGAEKLRTEKGLKIQIVSAISEGLFMQQEKKYRNEVIPDNLPVFGLTAGIPVTLKGLVGAKGKVFGLESFGYSAPYQLLDEKLGFTGENVFKQVVQYLSEYSNQ